MQRRAQTVRALAEGNSIRAKCRMTGASKNTVAKLLMDLGTVCKAYQDRATRNLPCQQLQCDGIWSFCRVDEIHAIGRRTSPTTSTSRTSTGPSSTS